MRFDVDQIGNLVLMDIDEDCVLADSQLDYPYCPDGWQYMAMDPAGNLKPLVPRNVDPGLSTRGSFQVGRDPFCRLGRDYSHPGNEQYPTLAWSAPSDCVVDLSCETAVLQPNTKSRAKVSVSLNGTMLSSAVHRFPEILRFRYTIQMRAGETLAVTFGTDEFIDRLDAIHYCWIVTADTTLAPLEKRILSEACQTIVDTNWQTAYRSVAASMNVDETTAALIVNSPFSARFDLQNPLTQIVKRTHFDLNPERQFGLPGYFSVKQNRTQ